MDRKKYAKHDAWLRHETVKKLRAEAKEQRVNQSDILEAALTMFFGFGNVMARASLLAANKLGALDLSKGESLDESARIR